MTLKMLETPTLAFDFIDSRAVSFWSIDNYSMEGLVWSKEAHTVYLTFWSHLLLKTLDKIATSGQNLFESGYVELVRVENWCGALGVVRCRAWCHI